MLIKFIKPDFKFKDERGSLMQLVHKGWNQVNYITSVAGSFRGNHYHKDNFEAFYVISGEFKLVAKSLDGIQQEVYNVKGGGFFVVKPYTIHSFEYIKNTQLISFYDKGFDKIDGSKDCFCT